MKVIVFVYYDIGCIGLKVFVEVGYDIQVVFIYIDLFNENCFFFFVVRVVVDLDLFVFVLEDVNYLLWIECIQ